MNTPKHLEFYVSPASTPGTSAAKATDEEKRAWLTRMMGAERVEAIMGPVEDVDLELAHWTLDQLYSGFGGESAKATKGEKVGYKAGASAAAIAADVRQNRPDLAAALRWLSR